MREPPQTCPFVLGKQGPFLTFQQAYRSIIIEPYHQTISHGTRLLEVLDMSHMQEVKTSIRENYTFSLLATMLQGNS
jgi:hypothetical protein